MLVSRAKRRSRRSSRLQLGPAQTCRRARAPDPIEQLKQLGELHPQGILTDEEFAAQKARILGG